MGISMDRFDVVRRAMALAAHSTDNTPALSGESSYHSTPFPSLLTYITCTAFQVPSEHRDTIPRSLDSNALLSDVFTCFLLVPESARALIRFDEATWERVVEPRTQGR